MRTRSSVLIALLLVCGVVPMRSGDEKKAPWRVAGQLEEACSCDAACPCWFGSKPTRMQCSGGQVIFIERGSYGNVPLDGLAIGMMGQSPKGESMMESMGNWDFLTIYIDEKANPEQRKALEEIARATTPPAAPPDRSKIRYVPITRKLEGTEHVVTLGSYGRFSGHLIPGGMGGTAKVVNPPGADPIHKEYQQGQTTKQTYTDAGQKWDWSKTNYMYTAFETDSEEYGKFNASMTQMMEEMKKKPAAK
jgi:hypothetical protein